MRASFEMSKSEVLVIHYFSINARIMRIKMEWNNFGKKVVDKLPILNRFVPSSISTEIVITH